MKPSLWPTHLARAPNPHDTNVMCKLIHANGEYATLQLCADDVFDPFKLTTHIIVLHLSKWKDFAVHLHVDYYDFEQRESVSFNDSVTWLGDDS
jgi:hypothetical protein